MSDPQIKVRKKRAYSAVPDDVLTNKSLSVSARLVLAYMIGRPDGWVIYVSQVCYAIGIGTGGKWRGVRNELEKAGYFRQMRVRGEDGKIKWHHEVTDDPTILSKPTDGDPSYQNPLMEGPSDGETIHGGRQDIAIGLDQRFTAERTERGAPGPLSSVAQSGRGQATPASPPVGAARYQATPDGVLYEPGNVRDEAVLAQIATYVCDARAAAVAEARRQDKSGAAWASGVLAILRAAPDHQPPTQLSEVAIVVAAKRRAYGLPA